MEIQKDDLYSRDSLTAALLNQLEEEKRKLRSQANRIEQLDFILTTYIKKGKITDTNEISCAISWLYHSDLSPMEIIEKVLER